MTFLFQKTIRDIQKFKFDFFYHIFIKINNKFNVYINLLGTSIVIRVETARRALIKYLSIHAGSN